MILKKIKKSPAFTLMEALLSISLITVISGLSLTVFYGFQSRNDLDVAVNTIAQSYRRAQILSQSVQDDSTWGLKIQPNSVVIFKGASYIGRDDNFDEIFEIPSVITLSGVQEIVFTKLSGAPNNFGLTTLNSINNDSKDITTNSKGMISF